MRRPLRLLTFLLAVGTTSQHSVADESIALSTEMCNQGWISLFDGKTQVGWQPIGDAQWRVVDGGLHTNGERPGFLMTAARFADFELHVEFRSAARANSGVFLRSALEPTDPAVDCYELNIAPARNPFPSGSLVARQRVNLQTSDFPAADSWHALDVCAEGGRFTVELDGRRVLEYLDPAPIRDGHVGLQSNDGPVSFREIRIRPLRE